MVAGRERIRVTHEFIEFHRADVVAALGIIAPTVGTDVGPGAFCVARQLLEATRGSFEISHAVEDTLGDDARPRRNTQPVKRVIGVSFTRRAVPGDDARNMGAVTVFVRGIG